MRIHTGTLRARMVALTMLLMPGIGVAAAPHEPVDEALAGSWQLDPERSDDAAGALDRALGDIARVLRPRDGRDGLSSGTSRARLEAQLLAPVNLPRERVRIQLKEDAAIFRVDDRPAERLATDGRPSVVDGDRRGVRIAAWEDGALWIERTSDRGTRVVERWRRTESGIRADYRVRNDLFEDPVRFSLYFLPAGSESGS
jgi:hypothetical protein